MNTALLIFLAFAAQAQTRGPAQALPEMYCIKPVYDVKETRGKIKRIAMPPHAIPALSEAEACNHLVNLVGTVSDQNVTAEVCEPGRRCSLKTYRRPLIRGGSIARSPGGCENPTFISQVNDLTNPGETALRLCDVTLSWDPANSRNREFVYQDSWIPYGGGLAHVRAGQKNPLYKPLPPPGH